MQELRGKADAWAVERRRLEAANAELQRSSMLCAPQKGELARRGDQGRRALASRWAGRGPWAVRASPLPGACFHVPSLGLSVLVTGDRFFSSHVSWSGGGCSMRQ